MDFVKLSGMASCSFSRLSLNASLLDNKFTTFIQGFDVV